MAVEAWGRDVDLPRTGHVLCGTGPAALPSAPAQGRHGEADPGTNPAWEGVWHAIGAGPRLVLDSHPHVTAVEERFRSDVKPVARAPARR